MCHIEESVDCELAMVTFDAKIINETTLTMKVARGHKSSNITLVKQTPHIYHI